MCNKVKYGSYREAQKFLRIYRKTKQGRNLKRIYLCKVCNMYHLTSMSNHNKEECNIQYLKYTAIEKETRL